MRKLAFAAIALMLVALSAPAARAGSPTTCTGALGAVTVSAGLEVPPGEACGLNGTTVTGNVTVRGSLFAIGVQISGNLIGIDARSLQLSHSTVDGNVIAVQTTGGPHHLCDSTIAGNVIVQGSSSSAFWNIGFVCDSGSLTVGGNLTFQNNQGGGFISGNTIGGNLDCHNNDPSPTNPANANTVGGDKKGQCAGF
jgi:hypothetical protein